MEEITDWTLADIILNLLNNLEKNRVFQLSGSDSFVVFTAYETYTYLDWYSFAHLALIYQYSHSFAPADTLLPYGNVLPLDGVRK